MALNTLVFYVRYTSEIGYYDDWLDAFRESRLFDCKFWDLRFLEYVPLSCYAFRLKRMIRSADIIVLLHSTNADTTKYLNLLASFLNDRKGLLIVFMGNEFNFPMSPISERRKLLSQFCPEIVVTQLLKEAGDYLFGDIARHVISLPHALNSKVFYPVIPLKNREIDIGFRGVRYNLYLGDNERNNLLDFLCGLAKECGWLIDIAYTHLSRGDWAAFLNHCKGTVSTEVGSWYLNKEDDFVWQIYNLAREKTRDKFLISHDSLILHSLLKLVPSTVKEILKRVLKNKYIWPAQLPNFLDFEEIYEKIFKAQPRCPVYSKAISSRHFEAMGTKTCQLLLAGRYNDILEPWTHYIPINSDFSNITEVIGCFNDEEERKKIVERAFEYAMDSHRYEHRLQQLYNYLLTL